MVKNQRRMRAATSAEERNDPPRMVPPDASEGVV